MLVLIRKHTVSQPATKRSLGIAWCLFVACSHRRTGPVLLLLFLILTSLASTSGAATAESQSPEKLDLIPEDQSLWKESLLWDKDLVLRSGFGYKDNVLLSPSARQGSGFVTSGLDLTIIRLPLDGWQFSFTLVGDDVRYFRKPDGLAGEDLFLSSLELQKYFGRTWRVGTELRYSYVDQVLEEVLSSGGAQAIEAKGNLLGLRPFIRRDFSGGFWAQLEMPLSRDWWQAPLDANWKFGGQGVFGWNYGRHSQVSVTVGALHINHDSWFARDALGNELGKRLALWREVAELKWEHRWDRAEHWASETRAGYNYSHDNGGGYFNYYRYSVSEALRLRQRNWEMKVTGGFSYFDFPVQPIAAPPAPTLHLGTVTASVRAERRLYKGLRCFGSYEYERTTSNDNASTYHYQTVMGGLSWEF